MKDASTDLCIVSSIRVNSSWQIYPIETDLFLQRKDKPTKRLYHVRYFVYYCPSLAKSKQESITICVSPEMWDRKLEVTSVTKPLRSFGDVQWMALMVQYTSVTMQWPNEKEMSRGWITLSLIIVSIPFLPLVIDPVPNLIRNWVFTIPVGVRETGYLGSLDDSPSSRSLSLRVCSLEDTIA